MMEVYFYCSYEHSQKGFYMTRLDGNTLVPAAFDELPKIAEEFFSFDRFQLLWRDISQEDSSWLKPNIAGSFFGIRGLKGNMSNGRNGTVNLAFWVNEEEIVLLRRTALTILGDFDTFRAMIFGWLSIGGPCSYQLDCASFSDWVRRCGQMNKLRQIAEENGTAIQLLPFLQHAGPPVVESELLHLAVCSSSWKDIYETMGHKWVWFLKPRNVLTTEEFSVAFTGRGPIWELTTTP